MAGFEITELQYEIQLWRKETVLIKMFKFSLRQRKIQKPFFNGKIRKMKNIFNLNIGQNMKSAVMRCTWFIGHFYFSRKVSESLSGKKKRVRRTATATSGMSGIRQRRWYVSCYETWPAGAFNSASVPNRRTTKTQGCRTARHWPKYQHGGCHRQIAVQYAWRD